MKSYIINLIIFLLCLISCSKEKTGVFFDDIKHDLVHRFHMELYSRVNFIDVINEPHESFDKMNEVINYLLPSISKGLTKQEIDLLSRYIKQKPNKKIKKEDYYIDTTQSIKSKADTGLLAVIIRDPLCVLKIKAFF